MVCTVYCILYTDQIFLLEVIQKCISDAPCKVRASPEQKHNQKHHPARNQSDTDGGGGDLYSQKVPKEQPCRALVFVAFQVGVSLIDACTSKAFSKSMNSSFAHVRGNSA